MKILEQTNKLIDAIKLYFPSLIGGLQNKHTWQDVQTFCNFIGYPRSGHSLIGALLNAHPEMMIAHEAAILKYAYLGFNKDQLYYLIMKKAELAAEKERKLGGYVYNVPNQWQGKVQKLKVIGDKMGEGTTLRIASSREYIIKLTQAVGMDIKYIHITRNPYDNISTIAQKTPKLNYDLRKSIEHYFYLCEVNSAFKQTLNPEQIIEMKHEDFLNNPQVYLKNICTFLGVEATETYLEDCASIVYQKQNKSRYKANFTPEMLELIQSKIANFDFLQGYTYDS